MGFLVLSAKSSKIIVPQVIKKDPQTETLNHLRYSPLASSYLDMKPAPMKPKRIKKIENKPP